MKVKIGDRIYSSDKEAIMIILEDYNKKHISNMTEDSKKYCEFPDSMKEEEVIKFMDTYE